MDTNPMTAKELIMHLLNLPETEKDKKYTLKEWKPKRSLSQNSYYWELVGKLAKKQHLSITEVHNQMLRDYGELARADGKLITAMIPDTDEAWNKVLRSETYHLKPTDKIMTGTQGTAYRMYYLIKGSSEYDTAEMTRLLDGLIDECRQSDIETLTPDQLARMRIEERKS